jgi:outer membrane biosynthesis protein TonB
MTNNNYIALARSQDQQKLPKILAYGIGGSLVLHGIAAMVFNCLPQQIPDSSVEVTLIDSSELPPEFKSSPTPTPSVRITPTPTPSAKITPTPTPSVKITPTPTSSVTIKPKQTPVVIRIVSQPIPPQQQPTPTPVQSNPNREPIPNPSAVNDSNNISLNSLSNLPPNIIDQNRQDVGKNLNTNRIDTPNNNNSETPSLGDGKNPDNSSSLHPNIGGKDGNSQSTVDSSNQSSERFRDFGGESGIPGNDNNEISITPFPGDNTDLALSTGKKIDNNHPPASGGNNSNIATKPGSDNLAFNPGNNLIKIPKKQDGSPSTIVITSGQEIGGSKKTPGTTRLGAIPGNGDSSSRTISDKVPSESSNSQTSKNPGQSSIGSNPGEGNKGIFETGLTCHTNSNCNIEYPKWVDKSVQRVQIKVQIKLDNNGQVTVAEILEPSDIPNLDIFTRDKFKTMRFQLPVDFADRYYVAVVNFSRKK